ncbi:MAG: vitamin K epoxide reductase family protein [Mariniblastus sp.]
MSNIGKPFLSDSQVWPFLPNAAELNLPRDQRSEIRNLRKQLVIRSDVMNWAMAIVAGVGLGFTSYLSWVGLSSSKIAGCGGGSFFSCDHVLQSKWSLAAGVPVAVPAMFLYLAMLGCLATILFGKNSKQIRVATNVLAFGSVAAGMAAVWFIFLQVVIVNHLCSFCLAAHGCGLVLAITAWWSLPLGFWRKVMLTVLSFLSVLVLATGQVMAEQPATFQIEDHSQNPVSPTGIFEAPSASDSNQTTNVLRSQVLDLLSSGFLTSAVQSPMLATGMLQVGTQDRQETEGTKTQESETEKTGVAKTETQKTETQKTETQKTETLQRRQDDTAVQPQRRVLSVSSGQVKLDINQWPMVGDAKSKTVFIEMFDYTCPHCRENHQVVKSAMQELGDDVAIVAISVPLNMKCNDAVKKEDPRHAESCELSRLSVALWRADREKFAEFHDWMFAGAAAPAFADAKAKATELVGPEKLELELVNELSAKYISKQIEIYKKSGAGDVPKLLFPSKTVSGKITKEALVDIIKNQSSDQ